VKNPTPNPLKKVLTLFTLATILNEELIRVLDSMQNQRGRCVFWTVRNVGWFEKWFESRGSCIAMYGMQYKSVKLNVVKEMLIAIVDAENLIGQGVSYCSKEGQGSSRSVNVHSLTVHGLR
jgi:hypothetical protein